MTNLLKSSTSYQYDYGACGKNDFRSFCFDAPSWIHKYIIGTNGLNLFGTSTNFSKVLLTFMEEGKIYIDGPPNEVVRACETLRSKVELILSRITVGDYIVISKSNEVCVGNGSAHVHFEKTVGETDIMKERDYATKMHIEGDNSVLAIAMNDLEGLINKMKHFTSDYFNTNLVFDKIHQLSKRYDPVPSTFPKKGANMASVTLFGRKSIVEKNMQKLMEWAKELRDMETKNSSTSSQLYYLLIDQRGRIVKSSIEDSGVVAEIQCPSSEKLSDLSSDLSLDKTISTEKDSDIEVIFTIGKEDAVKKISVSLGILETEDKTLVDSIILQSTAGLKVDDKEQIFEISLEVEETILQENMQSGIPAAPLDLNTEINCEKDEVAVKSNPHESLNEVGCIEVAAQQKSLSQESTVSLEKELCEGTSVEENVTIEVLLHGKYARLAFGLVGRIMEEVAKEFDVHILVFPINKRNTIEITGLPSMVEKAKQSIQRKCCQLDKELTEKQLENFKIKVEFDSSYYPVIFHKKKIIIDDIQEKNNVRIYLFKKKMSNCLKMIISGHKESAIAACNDIMKKVKLETVSEKINIPKRFHKFLIGPRGERIRSIQEECKGVYIIFPSDDSNGDTVVVNGPKEGIEKAKQMLKEITNYEQIRVHPKYHGYLIGVHGKRIKKLSNSSGAAIEFPSPLDEDKELITLMGSKASLKKAKAEIEAALEIKIGRIQDKISLKQSVFSDLMNFKGRSIKKTLKKRSVNMAVFTDESSSEDSVIITLEGAKENVFSAKMCLLDLSKRYGEIFKEEIHIESSVYSGLTGYEGKQIRAAMKKCGINVKFQKPDFNIEKTGVLEISGPEEAVLYAKKYLLDFEREYLKNTVNFNLNPEVYPGLIGQKSKKLKRLIRSCGAKIILHKPTTDSVNTFVSIHGSKKALAKSQNLLLDFEKEYLKLDKEEVAIKPFAYAELSGRTGNKIKKEMLKRNVDLSFCIPDEDSTNDVVVKIIGKRKAIEKAKAILIGFEKRLMTTSKEVVEIDTAAYSGFIGERGNKVRTEMKKNCDVDLTFPKTGPGANVVEIRGTLTDISKAKSHLIHFVEEYSKSVKEVVTFTPEAYSVFTGKRGRNIKITKKKYGVDVLLNESSSGGTKSTRVIIEGSREAVWKAKKHLLIFGIQHAKEEFCPSNDATIETIHNDNTLAEDTAMNQQLS